jgi:IS1 family transposase
VSKAAIARLEGMAWATVARWLERAAQAAHAFNHARTRGVVLRELQLDEMRSFVGSKKRVSWVFAAIEVWSRLWPATVVGSRNYRNTKQLVTSVMHAGHVVEPPLITTDGFKYYAPAIRRTFGVACVLGQVIKKLRKDRIVTVRRKLVIGSTWKLEGALLESEDSTKLNTSFIERLNLTIRRGCSCLARKTTGHARVKRTLVDQLELFRCYYNFIRPHSSLRFGREVRTPAMQAGLARRRYSFRDIFGRSMPGARRSGRVVAWRLRSTRPTAVPMAA